MPEESRKAPAKVPAAAGLQNGAPDGLALPLGRGAPSGEAGALLLSLGQLARLRSNPFFPVIVDRIDAAVKADAP